MYILLFALVVAVPVIAGGAGLVSFLLLRAGYGPLVWVVLPFFALLLLVGCLGALLGRAAGPTRPGTGGQGGPEEEPHEGPSHREPRREDDV